MLGEIFVAINQWITGSTPVAAAGAFLWGILSVLLSPCHMASIPLVVAYVAGQEKALQPRQAAQYALLFGAGLFFTIALIGVFCALAGRMLGDVGKYWQVLVGLLLIWIALGMLGVQRCALPGGRLERLKVQGLSGALLLGAAYGFLSGSCTFGFIAPILAIITIQQKVASGLIMIVLFALGHCLPIVVAGSSTALVRRLTESEAWIGTGGWFRRAAGGVIILLGLYFVASPFFIQ